MSVTALQNPLYSIIRCASSDLEATRRSIASIQAQNYRNFECLVACQGSSNACIQFLRAAAEADPRITLLEGIVSSPAEGLLQAFRRSRGEYVAVCPADGGFVEGAFERIHQEMSAAPEVGGVCCGGFLVDAHGEALHDVDIVELLLSSYRPYLPAGFLRRQALAHCTLDGKDWSEDAFELDLWCRIATNFGIRSAEFRAVDAQSPEGELFAPPRNLERAIQSRLDLADLYFSREGFFGDSNPALKLESGINQLAILKGQLETLGFQQDKGLLDRHLQRLVSALRLLLMSDHRVLETLHRLSRNRAHALGFFSAPLLAFLDLLKRSCGRLPIHAAYTFWNFWWLGPWITRRMLVGGLPSPDFGRKLSRSTMFAEVYSVAAALYDSRGQIDQALTMWARARQAGDIKTDSLACQALLKVPGLPAEALAELQRKWIGPHIRDAQPVRPAARHRAGRKIRVGYHCAFMNSDTIRFIMRNVIAAHDRERFEVYGYSPQRFVDRRTPPFDVYRHTPPLDQIVEVSGTAGPRIDDAAFVDLVRGDRLDVFVELSGFTPGHRLAAMGQRLAPVQISYLNHLGSTQVPNIDYVLADKTAVPEESTEARYYSEAIYRLPKCFLSYDYRASEEPPVVAPPSLRNEFVTFGYFGSGSKLNIGVIEIWAKLLRRVPGSKLHIRNAQLSDAASQRFLLSRFGRFGISSERLIVGGGVDRRSLMELYAGIDISLDTWPYCGGNTIAESLWQGVPVVTIRSERFVGAYGASLVAAAGCGTLVGNTLSEYEEIAVRLTKDRARLIYLREHLREMSISHGLADSTGFARCLEEAFSAMCNRLEGREASQRTMALQV